MGAMGGTEVETAFTGIQRAQARAGTEPERALAILAEVVRPQLRRKDPALNATATYLRARLLAARGEYDAALGAIRSARHDWLAAGNVLEAIRTDLGMAAVLNDLGSYRQAITVSNELLESLATMHLTPDQTTVVASIRARANSNLGNAWHLLGEHNLALRHYDVAANLFHALGERDKQAETTANRGLVYLKLGMAHLALEELTQAERSLAEQGLLLPAAKCAVDIAEAHLALDEVGVTIRRLAEVRGTLEELCAVPELGRLSLTMARALLRAGLPEDAHDEAASAADTFADLSVVDESARATQLSAAASMMLGDLDAASVELAAAERLFADCEDGSSEAEVWLAQARLARRRGDVVAAATLAARAAERLQDRGELVSAALARLLIAELTSAPEEAAKELDSADRMIATLDIAPLRLALAVVRARHERLLGHPTAAAALLRAALTRPHTAASSTADAKALITLHASGTEAVDELITALLDEGSHRALAEAWQWAAVAQTRILNGLLSRAPVGQPRNERSGNRDPTAPRADELSALSVLYDELSTTSESWDGDLARRTRLIERRLLHSHLFAGITGSSLSPDETLPPIPEGPVVHYHVLGPDIVAFVIREGQVHVRRLTGATAESLELVEEWRVECSRMATATRAPGNTGGLEPLGTSALTELYRLLFAPIADLVDDLYAQPLLVISHRHLSAVPFEALHDGGEPLSSRFSMSFSPGLRPGLARLESQPTASSSRANPRPDSTLVMAVPDDRAPSIAIEADEVVELRPGAEFFVGTAATAEVLRQRAPGMEIVHLACHGTFRSSNPYFSGLRLGDRWITAAEILDLDLSGTLVVLSSCASGRSDDASAEPTGMAWAFLAAGCRAVIASDWAVDDVAALHLMRSLYSHLSEGMSPRDALDRARTDVARRHPHPFHWSSFRYLCSPSTALTEGLSL